MSYREQDIVHENGPFWVLRDTKRKRYTVFTSGATASASDSSYALSADGLSLAKARADYLARRKAQLRSPDHTPNRGVYHGLGLSEDDLVIHQDHRGTYRVDLITSETGNHHDVTGRPLPTIAAAADYARSQQHTRGINGTIWVQRGDSYVDLDSSYVANGRPSFDLKKYGNEMQQWHSGMDAIYAVGSYASTGKVHPQQETIREAKSLLESYARKPHSSWTAKDRRDLERLAKQTGELLGQTGELDPFTQGFLEAALFSTNDQSREDGGDPLDESYSISDFDPQAVAALARQCADFQEQNAAELEGFDPSEAGADFWFTRCGHGVGFWDGDYPEPQATRLTEASERFGNVDLYVGDDGVIYASGRGLTPNSRHIPEHLQPYRDWTYDDFYRDLRDDGRSKRDAHLHATRSANAVGHVEYLPPRNLPNGWVVQSQPIFRRRDAKVGFEAHKGSKYMVFDASGKPLSPELSRIRGLIEWRDAEGWLAN